MNNLYRYLNSTVIRSIVYTVVLAALATTVMITSGESFCEDNTVEWVQVLLLLGSIYCFLSAAHSCEKHRALSNTLAACILIGCIRECDRFLENCLFEHAWKVGVTLVCIFVALTIYRNTLAIAESALQIINCRCFGLLLAAFMVLLFSRIFGHNDFWRKEVVGVNHKMVLRVIEEGIELLAYFVFLCGALEYRLSLPRLTDNR